MVLEAVEDHLRGYDGSKASLTGQRVARDSHSIEHLLPQEWEANWSVGDDAEARQLRESSVHLLGNLTLVTRPLNSKISNGQWLGPSGKLARLKSHDVMLMNQALKSEDLEWDESRIEERTSEITEIILKIWPVPTGHVGLSDVPDQSVGASYVTVADLIREGLLSADQTLFGRGKYAEARALVLADGDIQVGDMVFSTLRPAPDVMFGAAAQTGGASGAHRMGLG
jgi:hypothetical protein